MNQPDHLLRFKTYVVYLTAAAAVLGGLAVITYLMIDGLVSPDIGIPVLVLVAGGAVQFLFAELQSKRTEQAIERANLVARSTVDGPVNPSDAE